MSSRFRTTDAGPSTVGPRGRKKQCLARHNGGHGHGLQLNWSAPLRSRLPAGDHWIVQQLATRSMEEHDWCKVPSAAADLQHRSKRTPRRRSAAISAHFTPSQWSADPKWEPRRCPWRPQVCLRGPFSVSIQVSRDRRQSSCRRASPASTSVEHRRQTQQLWQLADDSRTGH